MQIVSWSRVMPKTTDLAIFTIVFSKGEAAKNRLPLSHVIATLRELDMMIRDVGVKVQREKGVDNPNGDFGIELLTGAGGIAFLKGSVKAQAAPTRDVDNAIETIARVIQTTNLLEKKKPVSVGEFGAPVIRHFAAIAKVQEKDKTELRLELKTRGKAVKSGVFADSGMQTVKKMAVADFQIDGLTIYGKLKSLVDRSRVEEDDDIWGELIADDGEAWRIKFKPEDIEKAKKLFTRQVMAQGNAFYFKAMTPRLDVESIEVELPKDYLKGFDQFSSAYEEIFGEKDPQDIIADIRG